MKLKKLFWYAAPFFAGVFFSCSETAKNPLTEMYVNFEVNLNFPQYKDLKSPGGYAYLTGGYGGVFVYNFNGTTFYAYDRACPDNLKDTPLTFDEKDKCLHHSDTVNNCNSRYSVLLHGAVSYGSAKLSLQEYSAVYSSNSGILRITNNSIY